MQQPLLASSGDIYCSLVTLVPSGVLFGVSNQLMATIGLVIGTTVVLKIADKRWYVLTCLVPLTYLYVTVNYAGYWMIKNVYWNSASAGYKPLNGILSVIMLLLGLIVVVFAIKKWDELWNSPRFRKVKSYTKAA